MSKLLVLVTVFGLFASGAAATQKQEDRARPPRKGEAIVVKGCLTGQALDATEIGPGDATAALSSGVTFRLTGDKVTLKALRDEHDGKVVEVSGVLKSDLPRDSAASGKLGRMRITVGTPPANPMSQEAQAKRSVPVLEVKSYEGGSVTCGR